MNPMQTLIARTRRPLGGLALALLAAAAAAHTNPVDLNTNPQKLDDQDVEARRPDFADPFLRDGKIDQPQRMKQLGAGASTQAVLAALGEPVKKGSGKLGTEWDYNLQFKMPRSQNYLVCQYKLVVDEAKQVVNEAVWRRRQCLQLVNGEYAAR